MHGAVNNKCAMNARFFASLWIAAQKVRAGRLDQVK